MSIRTFVCVDCGEDFEYDYKGGQRPLRCEYCRPRARRRYGLVGDIIEVECIDCGTIFEWEVLPAGRPPLRCDYCRPRARLTYGLAGDIVEVECIDCGNWFEWEVGPGPRPRPPQRCRACWEENERHVDAVYAQQWREAHRERWLEISRNGNARYYRTDRGQEVYAAARFRRRAHEAGEAGPTISAAEWQLTLDAFGHQCVYCGRAGRLARDHFYPLSQGGRTVLGNIVPACKSCNSSKGNLLPEDFLSDEHYQEIVKVLCLLSG